MFGVLPNLSAIIIKNVSERLLWTSCMMSVILGNNQPVHP